MSDAGRNPPAGPTHGRRQRGEFLVGLFYVDAAQTDTPMAVTLAELGVAVEDLEWLWEAVCEDLAEHSLPPELEAGTLDPAMTVAEVAEAMARALGAATMTVDDL